MAISSWSASCVVRVFRGARQKPHSTSRSRTNAPKSPWSRWRRYGTRQSSHARKIVDFLKSHGLRDNRCGSGREAEGNEEFEDSEEERREVEGGDDDSESDAEDTEVRREVERARGKLRKEKPLTRTAPLTRTPTTMMKMREQTLGPHWMGGSWAMVVETAEAVVERWKDVFDKFGVNKVNAICTDSASAYVAASKLLAQEEVKYSRITWLPCAAHVFNLLLSDIAKDGRDGSLGKREDTIIRSRAVVRFIREHGAALSLYRQFSAAHPSSASAAAGGSRSAPPSSQRRGRELVYPSVGGVDDERRLAADCMEEVHFSAGQMAASSGAVRAILGAVENIVALMTSVMQLLWRLDRGGRVMTRMWSWGFVMVDRVARASLNRMSKDELHIVFQACQARVAHMLEPFHCMAHLLNPRQRSITFFGAARRTDHERILADESLRYLRQQTGGDEDLYQTLRTQLAEFHSREGDWTYGGAEGDRDAPPAKGRRRRHRWGSENAIPLPRDEGVRPADRVTEAQRDRQVQRGRKDRLSKTPPSVATYFGRHATVLMAHELESVYDPEPDPMAHDAMEAEPWSDPDDLAMETEPGGSDDDDDHTPLIQIPRPRTRASTSAAAPFPAAPPPSSAPDVSQPGPTDHVESNTPHSWTNRCGQGGTRERVDEADDGDGDDREGYEGSSEDEDDPCYSPTRGQGDDDDDEGGDGGRAEGGLRKSERQRGDRCSATGRGGSGPGVGGAGRTGGAGRAGTGKVRQESASSTRTMHWVDEERPAEAAVVVPSPMEVAPSPAEFVAVFAEGATASAEGPGGFAGGSGDAGEVGRPFAQRPRPLVKYFVTYLHAARATSVVACCRRQQRGHRVLGQHERAAGDDGECRPVQERATESEQDKIDLEERRRAKGLASRCEMMQSVALRARVARMLETGVEAGDVEGECGAAGIGDAGERPASPVQGVYVLPLGGAMSAGEFERQAREDPLQADRRGRMTEASRRLMAEAPTYVPCSPSVPSSTTGVSRPAYVEGTVAAEAVRGPSPTPAEESPSPLSRKKKMRAGKSLSTVRRMTQMMRASHPGLAGLHPRTRAILSGDVVADAAGWQERVSDRAMDQPMSAPAKATLPHTAGRTAATADHAEHSAPPGRSMAARILREDVRAATTQRPSQAPVVWESGTDDLEMP
ncbi:hypothetical protein CBR_g34778 [Chara braunii]|uniref:DUF659 domain-containing protein n=1 Tax=Chara braunii TaxID=69332 RepID=A0A388LJK3_CHABU|nr:hypothetical protein CBR_g34778 [Chara braunii]|eukprot:GBG82402.1 hypothetical protein CBR_g34778 [Chara braunii]